MANTPALDGPQISVDEVLSEMDDRTRVGWDAAYARVENRYLRHELAKARNAAQPGVEAE